MIGAGISYYGQQGANYLLENGKIYDGVFDYDTVAGWSSLGKTTAFSINAAVYVDPASGNNTAIFIQGNVAGGTDGVGFYFRQIATDRRLELGFYGTGGQFMIVRGDANIPTGYNILGATYDGSGNASGIKLYVGGVEVASTITNNNLTGSIAAGALSLFLVGSLRFLGKARQLEVLNRVATAGEMLACGTTGSFQGASVPNSDYLLAVEFNKTGAVNPTTRTGTTSYAITAVGGAAYTQYLP